MRSRKHWFCLLDEALRGEVIVIQWKGRRLMLLREEVNDTRDTPGSRHYKSLLRVPRADKADRWSWEWRGSERGLVSRQRRLR